MPMDLRYLKWNGVYSLDGCCNAVHEPIDDAKQETGWSRMRALGFVLGKKDLTDNPGKAAIRRLLGMTTTPANPHVKIRLRVTTSGCRIDVTMALTDATTKKEAFAADLVAHDKVLEPCGLADAEWLFELRDMAVDGFATIDVMGWFKEDWKVITKFDSRTATSPSNVTASARDYKQRVLLWDATNTSRALFDAYPDRLDADALRRLAKLDDVSITVAASAPKKATPIVVTASRSTAPRKGSGAVVQLPDISVKVRRTPKTLRPFVEIGFVQLKLTGADRIQSMMFRVYRCFDPKKGIGPASAEQLVYQELLDRAAIDSLVLTVPDAKTYLAPIDALRGGLLKRQILDRDGERFGATKICKAGGGARAFDIAHAPYKFKVWVSTDPHAFEGAKVADLPPPVEARRSSIDLGKGEDEVEVAIVTPPPTDATVHDEAKAAEAQATPVSAQADWPAIKRGTAAAAFRKNKFWTSKPALGKNLTGTACKKHGPTFLADHAEQPDPFVVALEKDAWGEYLKACGQRTPNNSTNNFGFAPFATCCDAIDRHLARIEQRACCGAYAGLDAPLKAAIAQGAAEHRTALKNLAGRGHPYAETFNRIEKVVVFVNTVVAATDARDEYLLYRGAIDAADATTRAAYGTDPRQIVNMRRNDVAGHRMLLGGVTVVQDATAFASEIKQRPTVNNSNTTLPHVSTKAHKAYANADCTCGGELLLYPSYHSLSLRFFIAVRAAPLWVLALIDTPYIVADRNYMQPYSFFEHDMFHATDGTTKQQWVTMYEARADHLKRFGTSAKDVHELWQANCKTILAEIDKKADAKRKRALELLFFYLLHEPVDNANDAAKPPAVPEKKSLLLRLNMTARPGYGETVVGDFFMHELVHKLDIMFFGLLFTDIRGQLAGAYADAKTICDQLQTTGRDA